MKRDTRMYCIEGDHGSGKTEIEPTIVPLLDLLVKTGYWNSYEHRKCATTESLEYWLKHEWPRCREGSVLYFCTHGSLSNVCLSTIKDGEKYNICLPRLGELLKATGCQNRLIHFGGCRTFSKQEKGKTAYDLMEATGAMGVSGYTKWAGWGDERPNMVLELLFFCKWSMVWNTRNWSQHLNNFEKSIKKDDSMFNDMGFELYLQSDT